MSDGERLDWPVKIGIGVTALAEAALAAGLFDPPLADLGASVLTGFALGVYGAWSVHALLMLRIMPDVVLLVDDDGNELARGELRRGAIMTYALLGVIGWVGFIGYNLVTLFL